MVALCETDVGVEKQIFSALLSCALSSVCAPWLQAQGRLEVVGAAHFKVAVRRLARDVITGLRACQVLHVKAPSMH